MLALLIEPASVTEVDDVMTVWASTSLAAALRALKADNGGKLAPVDRIEPALLRADRHGGHLNHQRQERKGKMRLGAKAASTLEMPVIGGQQTF